MLYGTHANELNRKLKQNREARNSQRKIKEKNNVLEPRRLDFNTEPLSDERKLEIALTMKKRKQKQFLIYLLYLTIVLLALYGAYSLFW